MKYTIKIITYEVTKAYAINGYNCTCINTIVKLVVRFTYISAI